MHALIIHLARSKSHIRIVTGAGKRAVKGSVIGGMEETREMMELCGKHNITCDIELTTPDKINQAFDRVAKNDVRYRFVIDVANSPAAAVDNAQIYSSL